MGERSKDERLQELDAAIQAFVRDTYVEDGEEPGFVTQWSLVSYVSRPFNEVGVHSYFMQSSKGLPPHSVYGLLKTGLEWSEAGDEGE